MSSISSTLSNGKRFFQLLVKYAFNSYNLKWTQINLKHAINKDLRQREYYKIRDCLAYQPSCKHVSTDMAIQLRRYKEAITSLSLEYSQLKLCEYESLEQEMIIELEQLLQRRIKFIPTAISIMKVAEISLQKRKFSSKILPLINQDLITLITKLQTISKKLHPDQPKAFIKKSSEKKAGEIRPTKPIHKFRKFSRNKNIQENIAAFNSQDGELYQIAKDKDFPYANIIPYFCNVIIDKIADKDPDKSALITLSFGNIAKEDKEMKESHFMLNVDASSYEDKKLDFIPSRLPFIYQLYITKETTLVSQRHLPHLIEWINNRGDEFLITCNEVDHDTIETLITKYDLFEIEY
jgi:hypothetical protein